MFVVDGKITRVKKLGDGKFAYARGRRLPAAVLTHEQLNEVQRLNAKQLLIPFAFLVPGAVLVVLYLKSQIPFFLPALFGVVALVVCTYSTMSASRKVDSILNQAAHETVIPPHVSASTAFRMFWRNLSNWQLMIGTWLTGTIFLSSAIGLIAKLAGSTDFASNGEVHPAVLSLTLFVSYFLLAAFRRETRRKKEAKISTPPT